MHKHQFTWLRNLALVGILLCPAVLAWSDGGFPAHSADSKKTCYCGCDAKAGTPMCVRMCELAKYANRSWATSCQKKPTLVEPEKSPQTGNHPKKNNRVQSARL